MVGGGGGSISMGEISHNHKGRRKEQEQRQEQRRQADKWRRGREENPVVIKPSVSGGKAASECSRKR